MRSRLLLFSIAISFLLLLPGEIALASPGGQAGEPIPLEAYWDQVARTRQAVADLAGAPEAVVRAGMEQQARAWEAVTQVEMPDGSLVELDQGELVALLRREPPDPAGVVERLDALLYYQTRFPTGVFTLADLESLTRVLARPELQPPAISPLARWWNQLWEKINAWLERTFGGSSGGQTEGGSTGVGVSIPAWPFLVLILAAVLAFALRGLFMGWVNPAALANGLHEEDEILTSEIARQRAGTLSGGGDYRNAIRYLYLSVLLQLDERGLLRYDRSKTNREYLRAVASSPELVGPLRQVVDTFDRAWYGFESIDRSSYQAYLDQVDELRKQKP